MPFESKAFDEDTWRVQLFKSNAGLVNVTIAVEVTCLRAEPTGITPAGITVAARNSNYAAKKAKVPHPQVTAERSSGQGGPSREGRASLC